MKTIAYFLCSFITLFGSAQTMKYSVDLTQCNNDQLLVLLNTTYQGNETVTYNFPMTIPGTYAVLDYGRYISQFKAFDSKGNALKVKKKSTNTYEIKPATDIAKIQYIVDDSWEEKNSKTKIFEPAGTGFEAGKYFYINNGGLFGYFETNWNNSIQIDFKTPSNLYGFTTLSKEQVNENAIRFTAKNYHDLIDNPILFTGEKDETIRVQNTNVTIASYHENNNNSAKIIKDKIDSAMIAIDLFVGGNLPVNHYAFLNFIRDFTFLDAYYSGEKKMGLFQRLKLIQRFNNQGFGALEHGHSSSYFLADFGGNSFTDMIYETGIHEFMHIYTPLSLHSQYIGEFNYSKPIMSKHLWLYEGVTEYFSVIIAMQGGLTSVEKTLKNNLYNKIMEARSYPENMPFTEMSAHVFDKPYSKQYDQVYDRGAIMAMLLDIEIMHLTQGEKTLKSVIFKLADKYGSERSFSEEQFINEFVAEVDPRLKAFFTKYVEGTEPLPISAFFEKIGVEYVYRKKTIMPSNFLTQNHYNVKIDRRIINGSIQIKKADRSNIFGLKSKDQVNYYELKKAYMQEDGTYVPEGTMITIEAIRKDNKISLTFPAKYEEGTLMHQIGVMTKMTEEQEKLFKLWSTGK